jgi:hypothetical protein
MPATMKPPTSQAIAAELERTEQRRSELAEQLAEQRREVERLRGEIGRAVAKGASSDALRRQVRDREDEADGIARALPVLDEEIEGLRQALARAEEREAAEGYRAAEAEAVAAIDAVDAALRAFEREALEPLLVRLRAATERGYQAEKEDRHRNPPAVPSGQSRLYAATWGRHRGLLGILQALKGHADGTLGHVEARESDARNRILDTY